MEKEKLAKDIFGNLFDYRRKIMENKPLSRVYNRDVSKRKALRKRQIVRNIYCWSDNPDYYNNLHQYSKNKIHCSCP